MLPLRPREVTVFAGLAAVLICGGLIFLIEHRTVPRVARVAGLYLGASSVLFAASGVLLQLGQAESLAAWLALGGLLIRKGIIPFHSWMPDSFEFGHLVPSLLFHLPQVGTYAAVVLVLPAAPEGALPVVAVLGLVTALYGAVLSIAEADARRAFGYIFMAQSALVLAGIASDEQAGIAGGLSFWIASSLSLCGMGLAIAALELRRGRLSLRDRHGGYEQMGLLGPSFLVLSLASIGFPGTLGFLGQELLIGGTIERFPAFGFVTIGVTALTGITVLRMYFSLFCGRRAPNVMLPLRPREVTVFAGLAAVLAVSSLVPRYMVDSRIDAAEAMLAEAHRPGR
jgi:NADH-quinone oxidoreductase subunit M